MKALKGHLDGIVNACVEGWAFNEETPNNQVSVNLYIDDQLVSSGFSTLYRRDLEEAGIGNGTHAFSIPIPPTYCDAREHTVDVRVGKASLHNSPRIYLLPTQPQAKSILQVSQTVKPSLVAKQSSVPAAKPEKATPIIQDTSPFEGSFERVEGEYIMGWARHKDHPTAYAGVTLYIDGREVLQTSAKLYRDDLKKKKIGSGNHGLRIAIPASFLDGRKHDVDLRFTDTGKSLKNSPRSVEFIEKHQQPTGHVDTITGTVVEGWACDLNDYAVRAEVEVYIDDKKHGAIVADKSRPDLREAKVGDGMYGFVWNVPEELHDGKKHTVSCKFGDFTLPQPDAYKEGTLFGITGNYLFAKKGAPQNFEYLKPTGNGLPDFFTVRSTGATSEHIVVAIIDSEESWKEFEKTLAEGKLEDFNVFVAVNSLSFVQQLSVNLEKCRNFFLAEYLPKVDATNILVHILNATILSDYESVFLYNFYCRDLSPKKPGNLLSVTPNIHRWGVIGEKLVSGKSFINADIKTFLNIALPRLGCKLQDTDFDIAVGSFVWVNSLVLRHLGIMPLMAKDLSAETPKDSMWFKKILALASYFAQQGQMELLTATDLPSTAVVLPKTGASAGERTIKSIAFLLPQFHPVKENDRWWGRGFTEWNNVIRGRPMFRSHYQPRLPKDLGYYDLRHPDTQRRQAEMAQQNGVHGFCYHYYWFDGKKILNEPVEQMLSSGAPDHPFCVCWANENWSRNWDGQERFVLLKQNYTMESNRALIHEFIKMMRDRRYIRHQGKPVLVVYRIRVIPNWLETAKMWREECRKAGIGEIHLCAVRFGLEPLDGPPEEFGVDSYVLFPPHETVREDMRSSVHDLNGQFGGEIFSYDGVWKGDVERFEKGYPWPVHRGVMMGWDNTARRMTDSRIFHGATPLKFRTWLNKIVEQENKHNKDRESLVFVNAWNEWAEGTTLEPDAKFGDSYLRALRSTLGQYAPQWNHAQPANVPGTAIVSHKAPFLPTVRPTPANTSEAFKGRVAHKPNRPTVMLCAHISGHQLFGGERSFFDIISTLNKMDVNLIVCLPSGNNKQYVDDIRKLVQYCYVFSYPQWHSRREIDQYVLLNFADIIAAHNVSLVYANTIVLLEPLIAAKRMNRMRLVHARELISVDAHLQERLDMTAEEIISEVFSMSDFLIANSKATYHLFSRHDRTFYVPNAVKVEDFDTTNKVEKKIRFGIVSSNIPKKGVADFIAVAKYCKDKTDAAEFVIIGPENGHTKEWHKDPELPDSVTFLGYRESPIEAMKELNVLLSLSNFAESFGRTIAEAMAACRPVIGYEWGAVPELIQHGKNGYLVPYKNTVEAAKAVLRICEKPSLIKKMGQAGLKIVTENYSYECLNANLTKAMEAVFASEEILDNKLDFWNHTMPRPQNATVIIPVYNAYDEVSACIDSVLKYTNRELTNVLIINDGSTDERIAGLVDGYAGRHHVKVVHNEKNLGYTRTINKGIALAGTDDVVLLNSDTVVTPNWLAGLRAAAFQEPNIGTVTAMSDNAGAFSFPVMGVKNEIPEYLNRDEFAIRVVQAAKECKPIEVPTGSGFCMYISRRMMDEIGVFDHEGFSRGYGEENDFCMRALKAGWKNLITPWSYVYHVRTASFKGEKDTLIKAGVDVVTKRYPEYAALVKAAFHSEEMKEFREATKKAYL